MKIKKSIRIIKKSFFWFVIFLVGLFELFEGIKYQVMLSDFNNDTFCEYCGSYNVYLKGSRPSTKRYIVELENGDSLEINPTYIENDNQFESDDIACFKYSRQKFVSTLGLHRQGIRITSVDKTVVYLDENTVIDEAKGMVILIYFISFLIFIVAFMPIWTAMVFQIIIRTKKAKHKSKKSKKSLALAHKRGYGDKELLKRLKPMFMLIPILVIVLLILIIFMKLEENNMLP